jgi:hypothetical protein
VYALAGTDVPFLDPQQGLLPLPGLDPAAKHRVAVAQFALRIEPLLQSGAVGGTGPGRRPFLLVAGGDDFGGGPLHSATECTESRGDLNTGQHTLRSGPLRGTDRGRTGRKGDTYRLTLSLRLGATAARHVRHPRAPIAWRPVHPLNAEQARICRSKRRRPRRGSVGRGQQRVRLLRTAHGVSAGCCGGLSINGDWTRFQQHGVGGDGPGRASTIIQTLRGFAPPGGGGVPRGLAMGARQDSCGPGPRACHRSPTHLAGQSLAGNATRHASGGSEVERKDK